MRKNKHNEVTDQGIYKNEMVKEDISSKRGSRVLFSHAFLSINMPQFRGNENKALFNKFL